MRNIIPILALTMAVAWGQSRLAFDDPNPAVVGVQSYSVFSVNGTNQTLVTKVNAVPKTNDDVVTITIPISTTEAGKLVNVTAADAAGNTATSPMLQLATIAGPPSSVTLSYNWTQRVTDILWRNTNPPSAQLERFRIYRLTRTNTWEKIAETADATTLRATIPLPSGIETYSVAAVNMWGEARSPQIQSPSLLVPITNLRLITVSP